MDKLLVKRNAYAPTGWHVDSTYLTVQLYSKFARTTVKMHVSAIHDKIRPPLILHGQNLQIETIIINNTIQSNNDFVKNEHLN